jgi:hypothetical protein
MSTGYDNLSVTQLLMLNITFPFQYLMRCWNNLDFQMTSVKRVVEYTDVHRQIFSDLYSFPSV